MLLAYLISTARRTVGGPMMGLRLVDVLRRRVGELLEGLDEPV